jgi:DNA-directed RNA polymerase specialized sigma24 family protein
MIEIFLSRNGSIPFIQGKLKMSYSSDLPHSTKMDRLDKVSSAIHSLSNSGDTDQMMVEWSNNRKTEEHTPSICEQRNMRIVYENVVNLLKNLPESAHFRKPLIKQLFKCIKQTDISQACGISESTVSQAMKCNTDEFERR